MPGSGPNQKGGKILEEEARLWGTPSSHERTQTARDVDHGVQLANQAGQLGTPQVFDATDLERTQNADWNKAGKNLHLTHLEFKLLKFFIEHEGEVLTRDQILDEAWGDAIVAHRTIDPHIVHLRKKIEDDPARPRHILSVRRVGYKFSRN